MPGPFDDDARRLRWYVATRFGDFTLLEDLGSSESGDRYRAMHDKLGGPYFVKRFTRVERPLFGDLYQRCERLMSLKHPTLAPHLGHGEVEGIPFAVYTWLEGVDLISFIESLKDRRVTLGFDVMLYILREVARAVDALHRPEGGGGLTHGDVTGRHIRIGPDADIWLTGLATPRGLKPGVPPEGLWDVAGIAATVYDLIGLTRPGPSRPSLPTTLDRIVRRALGIGSREEQLSASELVEGLDEVAESMRIELRREALKSIAQRTVKAIGRRSSARGRADELPTLEPIGVGNAPSVAVPATIDLEPLDGPTDEREAGLMARVEPVPAPAPTPRPARGPLSDSGLAVLDTGFEGETPAVEREALPVAQARAAERGGRSSESRLPGPAPRPPEASLEAPPKASPELSGLAAPPASPARPPLQAPLEAPLGALAPPPSASAPPPAARPVEAPLSPPGRREAPLESTGPMLPSPTSDEAEAELLPPPDLGGMQRVNTQPLPALASLGLDKTAEMEVLASVSEPPAVDDRPAPPDRAKAPERARPREVTAVMAMPLPEEPSPKSLEELTDEAAEAFAEFMHEATTPEVRKLDDTAAVPRSASADRTVPLAELPPDIPLANPFADDEPGPPPLGASELLGLGASALFADEDEVVASPLADPVSPLDDPTRELNMRGASGSATAPLEQSPLSGSGSGGGATLGSQDRAVTALLKKGRLLQPQVDAALAEQKTRGGRLVEILVAEGALRDSEVADVLAEDAVKPRISDAGLMRFLPDGELLKKLPQSYAVDRRMLPMAYPEGGELILAVADPFDVASIEEVREIYGAEGAQVHVAALSALRKAIAEAYRPAAGAHAEEYTILLCVSDDDVAGTLGARFVQEGFGVQHAADGHLALALLEKHTPDAVLAAHDLAAVEGCDLLLKVRADERHAETPFFVFGPRDDEALEARVLDLGGDDYFERPLNLNVVVKKLRRALRKRPPRPPAPAPDLATAAPRPQVLDDEEGAFLFEDQPPSASGEFGAVVEDEPFAEPTGVMGTLRQMAVAEIVQSLELGRKTARVDLVPTEGAKGSFCFVEGQVVHALCEGLSGEDAFYRLARAQEGFFRIHYGEESAERTIEKPTQFLLLEAMRQMDEEEHGIEPGGRG